MSEDNGFAVRGTMHLLQSGKMTIENAEGIVNIWIELTAKKFYAEGLLDGLRRNQTPQKSYQALCDMEPLMEPQRTARDPLSVAEIEAIQTHLNEWKEGKNNV